MISDFLSSLLLFINGDNRDRVITLQQIEILKQKILNGFYFPYQNHFIKLKDDFVQSYQSHIQFDEIITIYIALSFLIALSFFFYFLYLLKKVHLKTEKILLLFLDIPRKNLLAIYEQCDKFLKYCQVSLEEFFI